MCSCVSPLCLEFITLLWAFKRTRLAQNIRDQLVHFLALLLVGVRD